MYRNLQQARNQTEIKARLDEAEDEVKQSVRGQVIEVLFIERTDQSKQLTKSMRMCNFKIGSTSKTRVLTQTLCYCI